MEDIVIHKIYRLFGAGMNYFGSTKQPLYERKACHKSQHKTWKKNGGWKCGSYTILDACEDWDIEIVEILPPNSTKEEVLIREKWWIQNNECVNKNSPLQTKEELKTYHREYSEKERREKGIPIKEKVKTLDINKYKCEKAREYRANRTEEEKEAHLKARRETRPELTEKQSEDAKERAKKQREKIKADPEKAEALKEYKRKKAQEYRLKAKEISTK
jgi:hypothetical protein